MAFGSLILAVSLLAITPARALDPDRRIDQFRHTRWTLGDGAPGNVRAIAQGRDGFLWLGTSTGLFRFDGIRFERIVPDDDDPKRSLQVTALLVAKNGDLWVGYDYGGIGLLRGGHLRGANPFKALGGVYQIVEDADGTIWVAADGNGKIMLSRLARGRWSQFGPQQGVGGVQAGSVVPLPDGSINILSPTTPALGSTPLRKAPGSTRFAPWSETLTNFADLARDRDGRLWLADNNGLRRLGGGSRVPLAGVTTPFLQRHLRFDRDGALWIAGQDDGLVRAVFRDGRVVGPPDRFSERNGLTGPVAMSLFEDREGNIWVGTESGLDRFSASNVIQPHNSGAMVTGFAGDPRSDQVFFGGVEGVFRMARGMSEPELIYPKRSLGVLCGDGRRLLAISMDDNTLLSVSPSGRVASARDVGGPLLITCTLDAAGTFWASIKEAYRLNGDKLQKVDAPWSTGKYDGNLAHLKADAGGGLIAGRSLFGVQQVNGDRSQVLWRAEEGRIGATNLFVTAGKRIYQGAQKGLGLWDGHRHLQLSERNYPILAGVTGVHSSSDGSTWLIGATGIARVSTADLDAAFRSPGRPLPYRRFGYEEGFRARSNILDTNDIVEDSTGRIWFATNRGVAWIDRDHVAHNGMAPNVVLLNLTSGPVNATSFDKPIRLKAGTQRVQIAFTALSLTDAKQNRFRYRLLGADRDWVDSGAERQALYINLGPGTYRFEVIGSNNDGVWTRRAAGLTFTIAPRFYQTRWFLAACLALLGTLIWLLYRWRLRTIALRTRGQFEARLAERERIARELHDTLMQGFQGVVLRFQSAANLLTPGTRAHTAIESALERADDVLVEGRDRIRELRRDVEPLDLAAILTATVEQLVPPAIQWNVRRVGQERKVCAPVADEISRVVAEAVANVARHANAQLLEVGISFGADRLSITVEDDGQGIPDSIRAAGRRVGHFGLVGMRERAMQLAGSLEIGSRSPAGTLIKLIVPARVAYPD
ncbi:sensor histidine kinase [Sphingomonas morindae]|uniref:Histidine kinase n=1 Tax=Sphingomonas morindae TaxID=1541170 RepID=A0ABY4X7K2_9SPHN|nr:sensor histidine kinase [Sphingomonas morindae]USI72825.1 histidine kinase [Sphingomonas morindae]